MKPTQRFSNRVDNYVRYRPDYPPQVIELMRGEMSLNDKSVVADIGSGTGIFAKSLLEAGAAVYGIEPNDAMREAGEFFLREFPKFRSVNGTAEDTHLPDASVNFITAAQAFHWFEAEQTKNEFCRVLRQNGWVVLVWNERRLDADAFSSDYERLLQDFGTDIKRVAQKYITDTALPEFFDGNFQEKSFENSQSFDFEGLKGRLLSSSYIPTEGGENYAAMIAQLERIFERHKIGGRVQIFYDTKVYYRKLKQ